MPCIDLNSDLGESFGRYTLGRDKDVMELVTSVNIACGMHAGDPVVMNKTVKLAAEAGVAIGAHPGYPDLQGFGRRDMALSPDEVYAYSLYQISALAGFCAAQGATLHHVKPHGQLYNTAAKNPNVASAIAAAVHDFDSSLILVGLAGGCLVEAGRNAGLVCAEEFFADRNYTTDGQLVPRSQPNASITDPNLAADRVIEAVTTGSIQAIDGSRIAINADTVCLHGDNEATLQFARTIKQRLEERGIEIKAR